MLCHVLLRRIRRQYQAKTRYSIMSLIKSSEPPVRLKNHSTPAESVCFANLSHIRIKLDYFDQSAVELDASVQDSDPQGSKLDTVVACPGSPGSHNDFKYILPHLCSRGIRFIGINFPGYGFTTHNEKLKYDSDERVQFVQKLINRLNINGRIIFIGHSCGSENALRMSTINQDRGIGVVLVNPLGLTNHHSIRPTWVISSVVWMWENCLLLRFLLRPFLYAVFKLMNLKVHSGEEAAICLKTMNSMNLPKQLQYINRINNSGQRVLVAYSGCDRFVETEISHHFASKFDDVEFMQCLDEDKNLSTLKDVKRRFESGERRFAVCFQNDGHFLSKFRAEFLAHSIFAMFEAEKAYNEVAKFSLRTV